MRPCLRARAKPPSYAPKSGRAAALRLWRVSRAPHLGRCRNYRALKAIAKQKKVSAWVVREAAEEYLTDKWPLFGKQAVDRPKLQHPVAICGIYTLDSIHET
jgi:hypothetical protein